MLKAKITFQDEGEYLRLRRDYAEFLESVESSEHLTFEEFLEAIAYEEDKTAR